MKLCSQWMRSAQRGDDLVHAEPADTSQISVRTISSCAVHDQYDDPARRDRPLNRGAAPDRSDHSADTLQDQNERAR